MTPEDTNRIIAAIDRNTQAVKSRQDWMFISLMLVVFFLGILLSAITAHASPILTTPEPIYEIGTPPLPPPNPNVQYWYAQYVPGPDGVLPVEVFAPKLRAANSPIGHPGPMGQTGPVDVPEPGSWLLVGGVFLAVGVILAVTCIMTLEHIAMESIREAKRCAQYRLALEEIAATSTDNGQIARKALEESK